MTSLSCLRYKYEKEQVSISLNCTIKDEVLQCTRRLPIDFKRRGSRYLSRAPKQANYWQGEDPVQPGVELRAQLPLLRGVLCAAQQGQQGEMRHLRGRLHRGPATPGRGKVGATIYCD